MRILTPAANGSMSPNGRIITGSGAGAVGGFITATANIVSPTVDFFISSGGVYEWSGYLNLISTTVTPAASALTLWFEYTVAGVVNSAVVTMGDLASPPVNGGFNTLTFMADANTPFSWWYEVTFFTSGSAVIEYRMATFQRA